MKIHQLVGGPSIHITNEEQKFIEHHSISVKIPSLDEHDQWIAQGLVRKGVYKISKDSVTLINNLNEKYSN
jgi:hypothetical protein